MTPAKFLKAPSAEALTEIEDGDLNGFGAGVLKHVCKRLGEVEKDERGGVVSNYLDALVVIHGREPHLSGAMANRLSQDAPAFDEGDPSALVILVETAKERREEEAVAAFLQSLKATLVVDDAEDEEGKARREAFLTACNALEETIAAKA